MLKPASGSSHSKLQKERQKLWDDGAFAWKVCSPPVSKDYCYQLFISYRAETDGAFAMALCQELVQKDIINYPGLKIVTYLDVKGTVGASNSTPEEAMSKSCLFIPVLSDAAVRPWLMPGFNPEVDTLFQRICSALRYSQEGAIDILPLLLGTLDENGRSRRPKVRPFGGIHFPLSASSPAMSEEQGHLPHQILYELSRFRGLHSSPKSVKGTANFIADILSKQTWPRYCSHWRDQDAVKIAAALQDKVEDETDEGASSLSRRRPRVGSLKGAGMVILLFLCGLALVILSLAASLDDDDDDCKAAGDAKLLCRLSWTSALCAVGLGFCFSGCLRELSLSRVRSKQASQGSSSAGAAEEDSVTSETGSGQSSISEERLAEEDPPSASVETSAPLLDGAAWTEEGCFADLPPDDFISLPAASALTVNGIIIAVASPLVRQFYFEWSVLLLFWVLGILSLLVGLAWMTSLLRASIIARSRRPFLRFHSFPFYIGGEIRACFECPDALKEFGKFSVMLSCVKETVVELPELRATMLPEEDGVQTQLRPQIRCGRLHWARAVARQRKSRKAKEERGGGGEREREREGEGGEERTPLLDRYNEDVEGLAGAPEDSVWLLRRERPGTPRVKSMPSNSHEGKALCTSNGIEIFFALPNDAKPTTSLAQHSAIYWEVEVEGLEPLHSPTFIEDCCQGGRGFFARFLVPVVDHPVGYSSNL